VKRVLLIGLVVVAVVVILVLVGRRTKEEAEPDLAVEAERVREVTLYFGSRDANGLVAEHRRIAASDDVLQSVRKVIEELISGPAQGGIPTIPSSVRLLAVFVHDKTTYLDFSREIIDDFSGGTAGEYMLISSVVHTACGNFQEVEAVRILVEGEEVDTVGGHLYISRVLRPEEWR
jgi:spore germination protein GerM